MSVLAACFPLRLPRQLLPIIVLLWPVVAVLPAAAINDGMSDPGDDDCAVAPGERSYSRSRMAPHWQLPPEEYRDWQQRPEDEEDEFLFWLEPEEEGEWEEEPVPANPLDAEFI